jgi:aminopeptidase N
MTTNRFWRSAFILTVATSAMLALATRGDAQRLPGNVAPLHYDLRFEPDLANATFTGRAQIQVRLAEPAATVVLNALDLKVSAARIVQAGREQEAAVEADGERQQLTLRPGQPLAAGEARLDLTFAGTLNEQLAGFYLGRHGDRRYAATQFEATDARRAFPCFDEPALKATFAVTLVVDTRDAAISNGRVVSDTPGPTSGRHTVTFETTKRMSTYLVAMVVGDVGCLEDTAGGVPLRVCGLGGAQARGRFAMEATKAFLAYFTDYFGMPYAFGKLDQIGVPDFSAGAMENTGAIVYRETELFIDERTATPDDKRNVANTIAHEIAHQWFGDLVTMPWWDEVWLNEGFATWAASKAVERWQPGWDTALSSIQEAVLAIQVDSVPSSRPIRAEKADTPAEITQLFDGIAYAKAAAVLRMLEQFVGEAPFQQGVRDYLTKHAYGNATAADLWAALAGASGQPVERVVAGFIDQPGAPLVSMRTRCVDGTQTVTLQQQRFFKDPARLAAGSPERWAVPVCLRSGTGAPACQLLTEPTQDVRLPACGAWTLGNAAGYGYYVTSYPDGGLAALAKAGSQLAEPEWLRFLSDQFVLVQAGRQTVPEYFALLESVGSEHRFSVLETAWGPLGYLGAEIVPPSARPAYARWIRGLLRGAGDRLGREARPGDSDDDRRLRALMLRRLAYAGDAGVLASLRALADRYLADPASVDPSLGELALDMSARGGDAAFHDRLRAALKTADAPDVRERLELALARFTTPALLDRTLRRALTADVRAQDLLGIVFTALGERATRPQVWTFLKSHFAALRAKLGSPGDTALANVVGAFCDPMLRDDARAFFAAHPIDGVELTLAQGFENAAACIVLRDRERDGLTRWLAARPAAR